MVTLRVYHGKDKNTVHTATGEAAANSLIENLVYKYLIKGTGIIRVKREPIYQTSGHRITLYMGNNYKYVYEIGGASND